MALEGSPEAKLTVLTFTRRLTSDTGRFTKQFFRCRREISAAVDGAFFRGAIALWDARKNNALDDYRITLYSKRKEWDICTSLRRIIGEELSARGTICCG